MKVALKFILAIVVVLAAIRSVEGFLTVRRETDRLNEAIERDARLFGRILRTSVRSAWQANGRERALSMIEAMNVGRHPMHMSWVPFEGSNGLRTRLDPDSLSKLADGETVSLRRHHGEQGEVQYFFLPIDVPEADGAIQMAEPLADRSRYVRHALIRELVAGGFVVVGSGAAVILLGIFVIGQPLSRLRERINEIGDGQLGKRLELGGHDELSALADGLNDMCGKLVGARQREHAETQKRIAAMEQMRHMDRLTTIGRLASGVAHELGTPLNVISGRADMISDGTIPLGSQDIQTNAATIKSQADRMTQIIRHLLDFARQRPPERVKVSGEEVVRQAVELVDCLGYRGKVRVQMPQPGTSLIAKMDPVQMQQVMTNLIENALQAMPEGGEAVVSVETVDDADPPTGVTVSSGRFLQITVEDQGEGIAEDNLQNVFDPFFTTKDVGEGTGLGLSVTYGIVREHGGWIDVSSRVGEGSCFVVYLPQEDLQ
ncbi:MAG: sensor histidine kinase [Planctomycetota bacterium]